MGKYPPLIRDLEASFTVTRGSFPVPLDVLDGDEYELRVYLARRLPNRDDGGTVTTTWSKRGKAGVTVSWRKVVTRIYPARR